MFIWIVTMKINVYAANFSLFSQLYFFYIRINFFHYFQNFYDILSLKYENHS